MATALEIVFWVAIGLVLWTQVGYFIALAVPARVLQKLRVLGEMRSRRHAGRTRSPGRGQGSRGGGSRTGDSSPQLRSVSLVIAAHNEESVIAEKVANALALDYPEALLEVVVACDGCTDGTAERARSAGAGAVLELPRGGKIRAQDAAVARSNAEIVAFSDANSLWAADALSALVSGFADPAVGYACGEVSFRQAASGSGATNQEGAYWRYEMALRRLESELCSITAGNGAIYAVRRSDYIVVDPVMGHDLSLPFNMVKQGRRAIYVEGAKAVEKMVPSIEGEQARKRRMMAHTWAIVLRGGMLSPAGYGPLYLTMILSHRLLRYLTPFLHVIALAANIALVAQGAGSPKALYLTTLALQAALLLAALAGRQLRWRGLLLARYYVLNTAALATGLWDWLRHGVTASWEAAEGTR